MDDNSNTQAEEKTQTYPLLTASVRPDQWAWLEAERIRQRHGNRSRLVQDALDRYRDEIERREQTRGAA